MDPSLLCMTVSLTPWILPLDPSLSYMPDTWTPPLDPSPLCTCMPDPSSGNVPALSHDPWGTPPFDLHVSLPFNACLADSLDTSLLCMAHPWNLPLDPSLLCMPYPRTPPTDSSLLGMPYPWTPNVDLSLLCMPDLWTPPVDPSLLCMPVSFLTPCVLPLHPFLLCMTASHTPGPLP